VNYAEQGLPSELSPESAYTAEGERFEAQGYEDCRRKYIEESVTVGRPMERSGGVRHSRQY
jgi:hypothetical protein